MSPPALVRLAVAGEPERWTAAGFGVEDRTVTVGSVAIDLVGAQASPRTVEWELTDLRSTELDGLPTEAADGARSGAGPAPGHPNGVEVLDHVVAFSPALDRTVAALEAAGLDLRRVREGPTPGGAQRQAFFRVGEPVLEVIEIPSGAPGSEDPGAPARFYGLAFAVADLDASAERLGDLLGEVRDAVQPGRRIGTVRRGAGLGLPVALMSRR